MRLGARSKLPAVAVAVGVALAQHGIRRVAVLIALAQRIDLARIRRWSAAERVPERFEEFLVEVERARAGRRRRFRRVGVV